MSQVMSRDIPVNASALELSMYHIFNKVWDEISYPFPNFHGYTIVVWEWISN